MSLADFLREMHDDSDEAEAPEPIAEAQVATLTEAYARYAAACPFKAGDLVTPRCGYGTHCVGKPHVVLEVISTPIRNFECPDPRDRGCSGYGSRMDIRVACFTRGTVAAFWGESWVYEPYRAV